MSGSETNGSLIVHSTASLKMYQVCVRKVNSPAMASAAEIKSSVTVLRKS